MGGVPEELSEWAWQRSDGRPHREVSGAGKGLILPAFHRVMSPEDVIDCVCMKPERPEEIGGAGRYRVVWEIAILHRSLTSP